MFTGIIEEIGIVKEIVISEKISKIKIYAKKVLDGSIIGDSISTNGVCLTITKKASDYFEADIMGETINRSNLGSLKIGNKVNLERALTLSTRLGGHIVSGHIDGVGTILSIEKENISVSISIGCDKDILKYIIEKGSIAIDGVSLTVAYVDDYKFKVFIIPHTGEETSLLNKKVGNKVNLECDVVGKYIERLMSFKSELQNKKSNITEEYLKINGFF